MGEASRIAADEHAAIEQQRADVGERAAPSA